MWQSFQLTIIPAFITETIYIFTNENIWIEQIFFTDLFKVLNILFGKLFPLFGELLFNKNKK